ncbi:MAG: cupin domain-containing protein [Candidatus Thermoplasmatota archaeon]|nr:cupin domain-containing protein [Candidatus Thermoplasmatota archaeon]
MSLNTAPLEHHRLLTPEDSKYLRARCIILQPGEEVGEHATRDMEEVIIILEGQATVGLEGQEHVVEQGHAAYIPPKTHHNILNKSDKPVKYVYVRNL